MVRLPARESDFDQTIIEMAHAFGWNCCHFRPGMTRRFTVNAKGESKPIWTTPVSGDGRGWPDWIFVKSGKPLVVCELKIGKNKPSPEQAEWLDLLQNVPGIKAGLFYLPDGLDQLEEILGD